MFRRVETLDQGGIDGVVVKYTCTSEEDVPKLPRFGIRGTQTDCPDKENDPCGYGSEAIVYTDSNTIPYTLNAINEWIEVK